MDDEIDTVASQLGEDLINKILENEPVNVILSALEAGAPIWYQNASEGISVLHAAAYTRNLDVMNLLIAQGAVWNAGMVILCAEILPFTLTLFPPYIRSRSFKKHCGRHLSVF